MKRRIKNKIIKKLEKIETVEELRKICTSLDDLVEDTLDGEGTKKLSSEFDVDKETLFEFAKMGEHTVILRKRELYELKQEKKNLEDQIKQKKKEYYAEEKNRKAKKKANHNSAKIISVDDLQFSKSIDDVDSNSQPQYEESKQDILLKKRNDEIAKLVKSNIESCQNEGLTSEQLRGLSESYLSMEPDFPYDLICEVLSYMRTDFNKILEQARKSIKRQIKNINKTDYAYAETLLSNIRDNIKNFKLKKEEVNNGETIVGTSVIKTNELRKRIGQSFALMQIQLALLSMNGITIERNENSTEQKWIVKEHGKQVVLIYNDKAEQSFFDVQRAINIAKQKYLDRYTVQRRREGIVNKIKNEVDPEGKYSVMIYDPENENAERIQLNGGDSR